MYKPLLFICLLFSIFSCKISRNSMREANYQLWLHHEDLELSERITGTAQQSKFLGIDWQRTFGKNKFEYGGFGDLPNEPFNSSLNGNVTGAGISNSSFNDVQTLFNATLNGIIGITNASRVEQMAMFDLIRNNPGYDIVMFPSFETHKRWFVFGSKTEVICTAKLGKLKASK